MLYLLFPKNNLSDFLENRGKHTNLSINYLQSLILYNPENIDLKMILIEKYTLNGDDDLALALNQELIQNTQNKKLLAELYKIEFLLEKNLYFKNPDKQKLSMLKKKLLKYYKFMKGNRDYLFFFGEATNIDYSYLKYHSLIKYLEENPSEVDYNLEKMAYDLATKLDYKEKAIEHLSSLMKYPNINDELSEYLIYTLFEKKEYIKAKEITTQLFLQSQTDDDLTKHFYLALYAFAKDKTRSSTEVSQLIQDYANLKVLHNADVIIIINTLLELGENQEAANFVINIFYTMPESFDEDGIDLALQALLYNSQLEHAQLLSFYALEKFEKQKYLNKSIEVSRWLSDDETVRELNVEGYTKYQGEPYLSYFLTNENLNKNHEILVQIYEDKIKDTQYQFIDNMAKYYHHTGNIEKAESYFTELYLKSKQKKAAFYAIEFSHHNSNFQKSLDLYKEYHTKFGNDSKLHTFSIQSLIALKRFSEAHALSKTFNKTKENKDYFSDLAWLEKDYDFHYQQLWKEETQNSLNQYKFEQLVLLEKSLNKGEKVPYLYRKSWQKYQNTYHLTDLLSQLLEKKAYEQFDQTIKSLNLKQHDKLRAHTYYQTLLAEFYVQTDKIELALQTYDHLLKLNPESINLHQNYLWLLLDNQEKFPFLKRRIHSHLSQLEQNFTLREQIGIAPIAAAMNQKQYELANKWIQQLILKYPQQAEYKRLYKDLETIKQERLYAEYYRMLDPDYLDTKINLREKHFGSRLNIKTTTLSHQWRLYKRVKAKMLISHYQYSAKKHSSTQNSLELSLRNSESNFLWNLHLGTLQAKKEFLTGSLDLDYKFNNFNTHLKTEYQNKTELTPKLAQNAVQNALTLDFTTHINKKTSITLQTKENEFIHLNNKEKIGESTHFQLSSNYVLRSAYPDISFNAYLGHHQFSQNIAQDYADIGFATSVGRVRQHTLNHAWKPFGTVTFAMSNEQNLGASATLGISKVINHRNSFDILFEYYNGIGVVGEPIYQLNLKYRF